MVLTLFLSGCLSFSTRVSSVARGFEFDTGPWIVPGSNPETTITISWTSSDLDRRRGLSFGLSPTELLPVDIESVGHVRRARLTDLRPGTRYFYAITGEETVFAFSTLGGGGIRFAVFGDMQSTNKLSATGNRIMSDALARVDVDLYVQLGDLVEYGGNLNNWKSAADYIGKFAAMTPIAPLPGNHERYGDVALENYKTMFPMDFVAPNGGFYSFDTQGVHFIFIDATLGMRMSAIQKKWIEEDLRISKARGDTWTFLFLHHTILTTGSTPTALELQRWLIPRIDQYGVDAVFFGHDHQYEHWTYEYGWNGLVYGVDDEPSGREVHYFCSGGGGARAEIVYGLLTHLPFVSIQNWYNIHTRKWAPAITLRKAWDKNAYIDHEDDIEYGQPAGGRHYYHAPEVKSYSTDNVHFGYDYGEQTLHYIIVEIPDDNPDICRISVHYPGGDLVSGPEGLSPQRWEITR